MRAHLCLQNILLEPILLLVPIRTHFERTLICHMQIFTSWDFKTLLHDPEARKLNLDFNKELLDQVLQRTGRGQMVDAGDGMRGGSK